MMFLIRFCNITNGVTLFEIILACVSLSLPSKTYKTFEKYRDNTENHDNFGHYNHEVKFSYRYIATYTYISTLQLLLFSLRM